MANVPPLDPKLFPNDPNSPEVAKIQMYHGSDTDYECTVGTTTDGRWFASYSMGGPEIFHTPQEAAAWLWRNGQCDFGVPRACRRWAG